MKTIEDIKFIDTMPTSLVNDENVKAAAHALDRPLQEIAKAVDTPAIYRSIDTLPSIVLDHLAVSWDATVWRDMWPVELKRSVLKTTISEKRKKGTVKAVKDALASISSAASIVEWWQTNPKGTPHTFTIYATQAEIEGTIDTEMQEDVIALIDDAKPARSHYDFIIQNKAKGTINATAIVRPVTFIKLSDSGLLTQEVKGGVGVEAHVLPTITRHLVARGG